MSVQKKSLISNRPTEKKAATKPAKETDGIGESKSLTAGALRLSAVSFKTMKSKK